MTQNATRTDTLGEKLRKNAFKEDLSDEEAAEILHTLKQDIVDLLYKHTTKLINFAPLHDKAYKLVFHKRGHEVYDELMKILKEFTKGKALQEIEENMNYDFFATLCSNWKNYSSAMSLVQPFLICVDRVYACSNVPKKQGLQIVAFSIFRENVLDAAAIKDMLRCTLRGLIAQERNGDTTVDWQRIKVAVEMLLKVSGETREYYEQVFEDDYMEDTRDLYVLKAIQLFEGSTASDYISRVMKFYEDEKDRAARCFDEITAQKVTEVMNETLVEQGQLDVLLGMDSGLKYMLANGFVDDLRNFYQFSKHANGGTKKLGDVLTVYAKELGKEMLESIIHPLAEEQTPPKTTPTDAIEAVIAMNERFNGYLREAFENSGEIHRQIQIGFEQFLSESARIPEFLSLYLDQHFSKTFKEMIEDEVEEVLGKAMAVFKYLSDKDLFMKCYKQHLSRRLLFERSVSNHAEKLMIGKIKTECGHDFTSAIEGMMRDMEVSDVFIKEYSDRVANQTGLDISVRVLTGAHWPLRDVPKCLLPMPVAEKYNHFKEFYLSKHNGRRLGLHPTHGTVEIKASFGGSSGKGAVQKTLIVSTYMMLALLCFNDSHELSFQEILAKSNVPEPELKRALHSMSMGKPTQQVLTRKGDSNEIQSTDRFSVNDEFESKATRVKIQPMASLAQTPKESNEMRGALLEDRKWQIDAAIVRTMKAKQNIGHNALITEVTNLLKRHFMPDPPMIKKCIESLIDREYMRRDAGDINKYEYIA